MAEARSASAKFKVAYFDERDGSWSFVFRAWRKTIIRRVLRTWNSIRNGLWPTPVWNLGFTTFLFSGVLVGNFELTRPISSRLWYLGNIMHIHAGVPSFLRIPIISVAGGIVFFIVWMYIRRWCLRILLSYRRWMYEPPKSQSIGTILWAVVVRCVSGYSPTTYSYQNSLPTLPVPALKDTLEKFLNSIKPLYGENSEEFLKFQQEAKEFQSGLGPKLQRILHLKSWWAQNWVTDWWEKYVYLMGRTSISINSNYYILDHGKWKPTKHQVSRAAVVTHTYLTIKWKLDRELLTPLVIRNTIPLCMGQYERAFSTTRIPGIEYDEIKKYQYSKRIAVERKGVFYSMNVFDQYGNLLTPQTLERQFQWIIEDADKHLDEYSPGSRSLPALTSLDRAQWASCRQRHFSTGVNRESLDIVESAIFHVILDEHEFATWSERGKYLLHGDGKTIWFDKNFSLIFFNDGKMGLNAEHSWADAPVMAHISEHSLSYDVMNTDERYDSEGRALPSKSILYEQTALTPERLVWDVNPELDAVVSSAVDLAVNANDDLDLFVEDHSLYGKGFIKTCKVSPDAYVQMALQLAYFRDSGGKMALTYEASMTRLYLAGRTETVRSLTSEAAEFVRAMQDESRTKAERIALLRKACDKHALQYKDAMNGRAFDRHLFGLYIACKGLGYENDFLKDALMIPWTLSTSQQPQQQIPDVPDCNDLKYWDMICPGGGFGPVSDKGYGVSYMIPGDRRLFFHVSSKKSSGLTDSRRFMKNIFRSLHEMKALFDE